ncbi:MAG: hemolysin III family protein [Paludibacter sp.]|jgi:hemolysin III|nr:hemolysin III family protein [Paludibacter sp.]
MGNLKVYSKREEKANYLTHAFGVLIAAVATVLLIIRSVNAENGWAVVAYSIFGFGMMVCMSSSTIYHYIQNPERKIQLRYLDHASIYLLIASSYSPFTLILIRNEGYWGWGLFALIWLIALVGIGFNFRGLKANSHLKTASYVLMGMVAFVALKPMIEVALIKDALGSLYWLGIGGVFYIAGAFFYALAKREFIHAVFHVFVLLGLISHIIAAWLIPV